PTLPGSSPFIPPPDPPPAARSPPTTGRGIVPGAGSFRRRRSPPGRRSIMSGTVGFIGLGAMGGPMAQNLVKHGFSLVVHDVDPAKADLWRTRGATVVGSAAEVAARVERTISMVETSAQAEAVIAGERGIIGTARSGEIGVSMSQIDPIAARRLADQLAPKGIAMMDAPERGGSERAPARA